MPDRERDVTPVEGTGLHRNLEATVGALGERVNHVKEQIAKHDSNDREEFARVRGQLEQHQNEERKRWDEMLQVLAPVIDAHKTNKRWMIAGLSLLTAAIGGAVYVVDLLVQTRVGAAKQEITEKVDATAERAAERALIKLQFSPPPLTLSPITAPVPAQPTGRSRREAPR